MLDVELAARSMMIGLRPVGPSPANPAIEPSQSRRHLRLDKESPDRNEMSSERAIKTNTKLPFLSVSTSTQSLIILFYE